VMAYRSRFWRQNEEEMRQAGQAQANEQYPSSHPADQPTVLLAPGGEPAGENIRPLADQPTVLMSGDTPAQESAPAPEPQGDTQGTEAAFDAGVVPASEKSAEQKEANAAMSSQPVSGDEAAQEEDQQAGAPEDDFAPRAVGDTLLGRYEI